MTDSFTEDDYRRVDENVDPTALNQDDIEDAIPSGDEGFVREAQDHLAAELEARRGPVRAEARQLLQDRMQQNPASGTVQLRNSKGQMSQSIDKVEGTRVEDRSGRVIAETSEGSVELGTIDLDAGSDGREDAW